MPPSEKVKKVVWVKSGGRCAMCREVLCLNAAVPGSSHLVGDIAHIVAEEVQGPRGNSSMPTEQRNSETNLMLLCLPHHKIVDDDPSSYTAQMLTDKKTAHEAWVQSSLSICPIWETKLFHLYYVNVPRLSLLSSLQGIDLDLSQYGEIKSLHGMGWELNAVMNGFKRVLQRVQLKAMCLDTVLEHADPRGMFVSFDHQFRTKNIRMPADGESFGSVFSGDPRKDPHIYCKVGGRKIVANVDTRWITTTTAFGHFHPSSGQNKFAGLGFVNSFDQVRRMMHLTPYVIGMPSNPLIEAFYGDS